MSDWDVKTDLSVEEIALLKTTYGPLFKTYIEDEPYYFKTLTRREAADIGLVDGDIDPELEEKVFVECMLFPDSVDFDTLPAGAPSTVCQEILDRSGLAGAKWLNTYLERARGSMTAYHTIAATICAAFPTVMPSDLDILDIESLMQLVVQAEEVLVIKARINSGQYTELSFVSDDDTPREMSDQAKDAMLRAMLEGTMPDVPAGVIDRTKVPPGANYVEDYDDML